MQCSVSNIFNLRSYSIIRNIRLSVWNFLGETWFFLGLYKTYCHLCVLLISIRTCNPAQLKRLALMFWRYIVSRRTKGSKIPDVCGWGGQTTSGELASRQKNITSTWKVFWKRSFSTLGSVWIVLSCYSMRIPVTVRYTLESVATL